MSYRALFAVCELFIKNSNLVELHKFYIMRNKKYRTIFIMIFIIQKHTINIRYNAKLNYYISRRLLLL